MADRFAIPTPEQFGRALADIKAECHRLRDLWRWVEPDAYRRAKHTDGMSGSRAASQRCGRCRGQGVVEQSNAEHPCPDCGGERSLPVTADVTGATLTATQRYRDKVRDAWKDVADALVKLQRASAGVNDALVLQEPPQGPAVDDRRLPHTASSLELLRAAAAKAGRVRRGNGEEQFG